MARVKLFIAMVSLAVCGTITGSQAQSKKEIIGMLTQKTDSLQKVLIAKNETLHQLEVKLAKIEGAAGAYNEVIKRQESKYDSVRESLVSKNSVIENLTAEKNRLTAEIEGLQNRERLWSAQNDSLLAALQTIKNGVAVSPSSVLRSPAVSGLAVQEGVKPVVNKPVAKAAPVAEVVQTTDSAPVEKPSAVEKTVPSPVKEEEKALPVESSAQQAKN